MKITDLLDPRSISLDAAPTSKSETLDKAVELMGGERKAVGCRSIPQAGLCERRREHDRYRRGDCNSSWKM